MRRKFVYNLTVCVAGTPQYFKLPGDVTAESVLL